MYNKLVKQAYFLKRLRDSGYEVDRIFVGYSNSDPRLWTMIINPGDASVLCTCYVNNGEADGVSPKSRAFFEIFDGGQFIPGRFKIDTSSLEVFVTALINLGIEPVKQKAVN